LLPFHRRHLPTPHSLNSSMAGTTTCKSIRFLLNQVLLHMYNNILHSAFFGSLGHWFHVATSRATVNGYTNSSQILPTPPNVHQLLIRMLHHL
jgi:hypothetical protein